MFGQPTTPCPSRKLHPWHSNGRVFCPGVRQDDLTPAEAGIDLETAVPIAEWTDLDGLARSFGVTAEWFRNPGGVGYDEHRQFITSPTGVQYVAPCRYDATRGGIVLAGDTRLEPYRSSEGDRAADREERWRDHLADGSPL